MWRKQHILLHLVWFKAPSLPWPGYPFLGSLVLWSIQKLHDLNGVFFLFFMRGRSYSFLTSFHSRLHSTVSLAFFTFPSFSLPMVAILWPVQNKNNYVLLLTRGENHILLLWYICIQGVVPQFCFTSTLASFSFLSQPPPVCVPAWLSNTLNALFIQVLHLTGRAAHIPSLDKW